MKNKILRCSWLGVGLVTALTLQSFGSVVAAQTAESTSSPSYTFVVVNIPDQDDNLGGTDVIGINRRGEIVGTSDDSVRSFLLSNFRYSEIACPGVGASQNFAVSINQHGDIAGFCRLSAFVKPMRDPYVILDFPGAFLTSGRGINNERHIVGYYRKIEGGIGGPEHGFVWDNGLFSTLDVPFPEATRTLLWGINNRDQIVGSYLTADGFDHAFFYDGQFFRIDFPGARSTFARGINDRGEIVGAYVDSQGTHGFVLDAGTFTTIDAPFPGVSQTVVNGINNRGLIVGDFGQFVGTNFVRYGFVATPSPVSAPGQTSDGSSR